MAGIIVAFNYVWCLFGSKSYFFFGKLMDCGQGFRVSLCAVVFVELALFALCRMLNHSLIFVNCVSEQHNMNYLLEILAVFSFSGTVTGRNQTHLLAGQNRACLCNSHQNVWLHWGPLTRQWMCCDRGAMWLRGYMGGERHAGNVWLQTCLDVSHLFDGAAVSGSLWCDSKPTSLNMLKASICLRRL